MAAVRTMFSAAREEASLISAEIATTARVGIAESSSMAIRAEAEAMNPVAVRQLIETTVKESADASSSILGQHLALTRAGAGAGSSARTSILQSTAITSELVSVTRGILPESANISSNTSSLITQTLEQDLGVSIKETMSNAVQTGLEEDLEDLVKVGKALVSGGVKEVTSSAVAA